MFFAVQSIYLSISSAGKQISNMVQRKTLLGCLFRAQETNEVNSVTQHQESCVDQLTKVHGLKPLHTKVRQLQK